MRFTRLTWAHPSHSSSSGSLRSVTGGGEKRLVTLGVKVAPEVVARLDALKRGQLNKSQVARQALLLGLGLLEGNPSLLLEDADQPPKRRPSR